MENSKYPAFPTEVRFVDQEIEKDHQAGNGALCQAYGLTKREYIAAKVLPAIVGRSANGDVQDNVSLAVRYADRLLAQIEATK